MTTVQSDLIAYVMGWRETEFQRGKTDCVQFVRGWVKRRTGKDPAKRFAREDYESLAEGYRRLREEGLRDPVDLAAAVLDEIAPVNAGVGDVVAFGTDEGDALGLHAGEVIYVVRREQGLAAIPRSLVKRAFTWQA